ncbi:hypothetical protein J7T55_008477 [Diaporthe amygdali]|uniref:uncharacterized protein n=1 Tax=Phomopsis amygdali TaxID=1214568 RepID=UPI0022FE2D74|nr:uncharacterized protein J7T55_008477 [Diaporthe amygdali]KAJ0121313.1 hypothetical protein J7T55_008477 [Diaporthe amygdali]
MRSATLTCISSLLLLAHHVHAFDIYLNEDSDCPEDEISIVCEEQEVGDCCNGLVRTMYSSAQASDDQGGVVLYGLDQGQDPESSNRCGLQLVKDDECATTDVPQGSAAGALGSDGDDEDPSTDKDPTDGEEDGEDDGGGDHDRRHARDVSPKKETWIEKNKKVKRAADGWRQTQPTAYAVRDATHVWKLSRDSEHAPAYEALTDRQERIDFLKRHGVAKRR